MTHLYFFDQTKENYLRIGFLQHMIRYWEDHLKCRIMKTTTKNKWIKWINELIVNSRAEYERCSTRTLIWSNVWVQRNSMKCPIIYTFTALYSGTWLEHGFEPSEVNYHLLDELTGSCFSRRISYELFIIINIEEKTLITCGLIFNFWK